MLAQLIRRALLPGLLLVALLAVAPVAMASTVTKDGGNLVWTDQTGYGNNVNVSQDGTTD